MPIIIHFELEKLVAKIDLVLRSIFFNLAIKYLICAISIFCIHLIQLTNPMKYSKKYINHQAVLLQRYKRLMEEAYNVRHTDSALSDISEYRAIKLLHKINKLEYLIRGLDTRSTELNNLLS